MAETAGNGPVSESLARASSRQRVHPGDSRGGSVFAREKALGEEDELRWWETRVGQAVRRQGLQVG